MSEQSSFEKHLQTVVQVIVTVVLIWVGSSLLDVRDRLIRLEVLTQSGSVLTAAEITRLKERVDVLERQAKGIR